MRDIEQTALIENSRRLRAELAQLVSELQSHIHALQAEIDRRQIPTKESPGA